MSYRGYMGVHGENVRVQGEVEPGEELDDIQWLRHNYRLVLDREVNLLEYLAKTLADFDHRIAALEDKYKGG